MWLKWDVIVDPKCQGEAHRHTIASREPRAASLTVLIKSRSVETLRASKRCPRADMDVPRG